MVCLCQVHSSNKALSTTSSTSLVAVFVGATSGIGEATVKAFVRSVRGASVYIVGRSQAAGLERSIVAECRTLDPTGRFTFLRADVSLIRNVDRVCREIRARESVLHVLFMSPGVASFEGCLTTEGLHLLAALNYYSRIRFIVNLLPLIRAATSLRRVVSVGGGTCEGSIDVNDFQALKVPVAELRAHLSTLVTLGLEAVAKTAPEVSFIHDYPGTVKTRLLNYMSEEQLAGITRFVPIDESGARHLFLATSGRFPAKVGGCDGVQVVGDVATGTNGESGTGMYSVGSDCESAGVEIVGFLAEARERGVGNRVWQHTEEEFARILASA